MKVNLRAGDETRTMRVVRRGNTLHVTTEGGDEIELRLLSTTSGGFELEHGHARIHGAGTVINGHRQMWINGRTVVYERARPSDGVRQAAADTDLSSTIPAVVLDVLVAPGQAVTAGQKLVLLESMKMVLPVLAPYDGTVRAVACRRGDSVAAGVPLVELDPVTPVSPGVH
jgi:biotin carboxyl carrier protein